MTTLSPSDQILKRSTGTIIAQKWPAALPWLIWFAIPVGAILAFAIFQPLLVLPRMGLGPGFGLVDQQGVRLTNEDLRGRIVLYNFTYTNCAAPCPQTTGRMAEVRALLATMNTRNIPVELVTISFDPERDTPAQLQAFAARYGANPQQATTDGAKSLVPWHFVTGEALPLKYVIGGGFGSYYQANEDGSFTFDPTFVMVDGAGIIRAKYRNAMPDLPTLQRDIELIAKEAAESTGATRLAYEAAHLFLCYPK
jgi:protein SCO1/2